MRKGLKYLKEPKVSTSIYSKNVKRFFSARNGFSNGNSLINGNGLTNGSRPTLKRGLSNGNGLINGNGLTNGNGITNGNGLTNGSVIQHGSLSKRKESKIANIKSRSRRSMVIKTVVAVVLLIVPLSLYLIDIDVPPYDGIIVDGNFQDWDGMLEYQDTSEDQLTHPDINIIKCKVAKENKLISFYVEVKGNILNGEENENGDHIADSVRIFIDSDSSSETGYLINGIGADYMTMIHGKDGRPAASSLYIFNPRNQVDHLREQNDWNGWIRIKPVSVATSVSRLEAQIAIFDDSIELGYGRVFDQILVEHRLPIHEPQLETILLNILYPKPGFIERSFGLI